MPLVLGLIGLVAFFAYEALVPAVPIVSRALLPYSVYRSILKRYQIPYSLIGNRTSVSGFLQAGLCYFLGVGITCTYLTLKISRTPLLNMHPARLVYLPVYFQACKDVSPITSGTDILGITCTMAPIGIVAGLSVAATQKYRPQMWLGWVLSTVGVGLLITVNADTPTPTVIGFEVLAGVGIGILTSTVLFPVLAPLDITSSAHAVALYTFSRNFFQASSAPC